MVDIRFLLFIFLIWTIHSLTSCALPVSKQPDPMVYYKRTLRMEAGDRKGYGTLVLKRSRNDKYKLKMRAENGEFSIFGFRSCHQEHTLEDPRKGLFKRNDRMDFEFTLSDLEKNDACPIAITGWDKRGPHNWGYVVVEEASGMGAYLTCNGSKYNAGPTSICQGREGSIQQISFTEPVDMEPTRQQCAIPVSKDKKNFTYFLPKRECRVWFMGLKSKKLHIHHMIGYEQLLIRSVRQ